MATYLLTVYAPRCLDKLTLSQEGQRMENNQKGSGQSGEFSFNVCVTQK